jgi:hypothetical protein
MRFNSYFRSKKWLEITNKNTPHRKNVVNIQTEWNANGHVGNWMQRE